MNAGFAPGRRRWLTVAAAAPLAACGTAAPWVATTGERGARPRVLVVGGGWGGATAARYLRRFSAGQVEVVLVEPASRFVSCPASNLVLGGSRTLADLTRGYEGLAREGVQVVRDEVAAIDPAARSAVLARGPRLTWDRLVLAPGVELQTDAVPGLRDAQAQGLGLAAWKAGEETLALRRQLEAMPDGGVVAITVPAAPYRCPPGPYERACQIAAFLEVAKPRAKVLLLDENPDITSKAALFRRAFTQRYAGRIEYRPRHRLTAVEGATGTLRFELEEPVRADVLNVLPPMRAGTIAQQAGLANANARWCGVDYRDFASTAAPGVHVIGDAILAAPLMPKSGHMANAHGKVAAAAIVAALDGRAPDPQPLLTNTCYSHIDARTAIHVASVHRYEPAERTYRVVPGASGVSEVASETESRHAWGWARTIWADMLG